MRWPGRATVALDSGRVCRIRCRAAELRQVCEWLMGELGFAFATLIVEEQPAWLPHLCFLQGRRHRRGSMSSSRLDAKARPVPSISGLVNGPSVDWHEREAEDLFGLTFEGHPRLGDFVLHEEWPEGVNPMRRDFDAAAADPCGHPSRVGSRRQLSTAPGAFAMPIGPVFSDFAESAHFLLETVGEDVIRTIPRFFYKYRGVEKIAEGQPVDRVLLLRRAVFGHRRLRARLGLLSGGRDHLRNRCAAAGAGAAHRLCRTRTSAPSRGGHHRHLQFDRAGRGDQPGRADRGGAVAAERRGGAPPLPVWAGPARWPDLRSVGCGLRPAGDGGRADSPGGCAICTRCCAIPAAFSTVWRRSGSSPRNSAVSYGLVGPIARASGVRATSASYFLMRPMGPNFVVPAEQQGDGYARLRVFFREAEQSAAIIARPCSRSPTAQSVRRPAPWQAGAALGRGRGALTAQRSTGSAQCGWHRRALSHNPALLRQLARLPSCGREFRVPGFPDHPGELRAVDRRKRPIGARDGELGAERPAHRDQEQPLSGAARAATGGLARSAAGRLARTRR